MMVTLVPAFEVGRGRSPSTDLVERCIALNSSLAKGVIEASPVLQREVVLVPLVLDESLARCLALSLHASAVRIGDRWRVTRSSDVARSLRKADAEWLSAQAAFAARRTAAFATDAAGPSLGVLKALRTARTDFDAHRSGSIDDSGSRAQEATPAAGLLASVLSTMRPADLALAEAGVTTVFSNEAVGSEQRLGDVRAALARYLSAQERFSAWANEAIDSGKIEEKYQSFLRQAEFASGPRTLLLSVIRGGPAASFNLAIYNQAGDLESHALLSSRKVVDNTGAPSTKLGKDELPRDYSTAAAQESSSAPSLNTAMLNPDLHDPLDERVRGCLSLYARRRGFRRVVACVPDSLLMAADDFVKGSTVDLDRLSRALAEADCEELVVEETLVVRPIHPLQEEALRVDRRPLADEYRAAAQGRFDLRQLLTLHAAYARTYDTRPFLSLVELPLQRAFRLAESPNWSIPHPVLAALGELSPLEWSDLAAGRSVPLSLTSHAGSAWALAFYASHQSTGRKPLLNALTRILADPAGLSLSASSTALTLVKRITRDVATQVIVDRGAGTTVVEQGKRVLMDSNYVPFGDRLIDGWAQDRKRAYRALDARYLFFWAQERQMAVVPTVGRDLRLGPFTLRERLGESKDAVPLDQVPGIERVAG